MQQPRPANPQPTANPQPPTYTLYNEAKFAAFDEKRVEVGRNAVWRVSTAKHGNGVAQLRDGDPNTYWQSDGAQPHTVHCEFPRLTATTYVCILLNFQSDDSYTPRHIVVRSGTYSGDITEITQVELDSPRGWVMVPLRGETEGSPLYSAHLQVVITDNHQNGRDTHVRGVRVYADMPGQPYRTPLMNSMVTLR